MDGNKLVKEQGRRWSLKLKNRNEIGQLLNELNLTGAGIEIGVAHGNFADIWIPTCNLEKVYLLDPWQEEIYNEYIDDKRGSQSEQERWYNLVIEKMNKFGDRVEIIRGDSREEFKRFSDNYFDFIYIDANHQYEAVKTDLANWYPKCKVGGVFAGHDYMDGYRWKAKFGVKRAVTEFCKEINATVSTTGERRGTSWYLIKK